MKHLFMFNVSFKSHLIRHSGTGRVFKDTERALEHLRHSESTRALKALGHSSTQGTRALGHLDTRGTLFSRLQFLLYQICVECHLLSVFNNVIYNCGCVSCYSIWFIYRRYHIILEHTKKC